MGILIRFARKWVAGEGVEDAIKRAGKTNEKGMEALIDIVGEHYTKISSTYGAMTDYIYLMDLIRKKGITGSVSLKLTQLGLMSGRAVCLSNMMTIMKEAKKRDVFVWVDMESLEYVQGTIDVYFQLLKKFNNAGICIQANLKRSENDLRKIITKKGVVRLVKGAYRETHETAFRSYKDIDKNFAKLMKMLFEKSKSFAIATHDKKLIDKAIKLSKKHKKKPEFQMLMGVRDCLKAELIKKGYKASEYIPFGKEWLPYFLRRLKERKRNILLILRSLFTGS